MINENFKIEKKEAVEYPPLPDNIYQVELLDVNIEKRPTYATRNAPDDKKEYENLFNFQFVLLMGLDTDGTELRRRCLWRNFVPTFLYISKKNGKNVLYQIIEASLRRDLTPEEEATMDTSKVNKLIGTQCRVVVKKKVTDSGTWSNIENFLPIEAEITELSAEEKEQCRVKKDDEKAVNNDNVFNQEQPQAGHVDENIPMDDLPADEVKVEDLPF